MNNHAEILRKLAERCQRNLAGNSAAQEFLQRNGVPDAAVWSAFRVGVGDPGILDAFQAEREQLRALGLLPVKGVSPLLPSGLLMPTYDPRQPVTAVGLVKVAFSQNQHRFLTQPAGLICTDACNTEKIIIADCPFLGLRLAQAGARGVVVAESPLVLAVLTDWLRPKQIAIAGYKSAGLNALKDGLGALAARVEKVHVPYDLGQMSAEMRSTLGLPNDAFPAKEQAPMSAQLVRQIWEYSKGRLATGAGVKALKSFGADMGELVQIYGLGYLPAGFRETLNSEARSALSGNKIASAIVVPAFDEQGSVVDLLTIGASRLGGMWNQARGLLAAKLASSFDHLLITDTFRTLATLFKAGAKNVLLLRGVEDARLNAKRMAEAGVRSVALHCRREAAAIQDAFSSAGIAVENPRAQSVRVEVKADEPVSETKEQSVPTCEASTGAGSALSEPAAVDGRPVLSGHDLKAERATFKSDDATYTVEVSTETDTRLEVRLERAGKVHIDRFDLAVDPQRKRFAASAAMKTTVAFERIEADLIAILDEVRRMQERLLNPGRTRKAAVELSAVEKNEALTFLRKPDLLEAIASDLAELGWVGEENAKRLLYLAAVSRKLHAPVSAALLASSGAGKSKCLETIAELTAPEDRIHVSRLSESSLYYHEGDSLAHKLLIVDEADALTPEVIVALRVLQTRGALAQSQVMRNPDGSAATHFIEVRGPVAVLTSTAGKLDEQVLSRCFEVPVDESTAQTERVLSAMRKVRSDPDYAGHEGKRAKIVRRHHNLQRMLESKAVLIGFADRIQFPASNVRYRREMERFLNLIEASALLHQHQRLRHKNASGEEFIVADLRDYEIAVSLAAESIGRASDELTVNGREVLTAIMERKLTEFSIDDLKASKPDWTRYKLRAGLDELLRLEVLTSPVRGRGKARQYELQAPAVSSLNGASVRLLSGREVGELAKVGENEFANFTPKSATG